MHDHEDKVPRGQVDNIILVGNANVGKSVIFGLLTGRYVTVSNYPGTTVEVTHSNLDLGDRRFHLIDTPGTNSLIPLSEDERVTRDILVNEKARALVQVADAKNMKRTLLLATQIAEAGRPAVLVLNMWDEATERGVEIDTAALSERLGIPVIQAIAPQKKGLNQLRNALLAGPPVPTFRIDYGRRIEGAVEELAALLPESALSRRALALMFLADAPGLDNWLMARMPAEAFRRVEAVADAAQKHFERPLSEVIAAKRLKAVESIYGLTVKRIPATAGRTLRLIGRLSTHPVYGLPILAAALYLTWLFVGRLGAGVFVDFLESVVFGRYLNPWAERLAALIPSTFIQDLLVGPYGIMTMAVTYAIGIILPITVTFFIAFGVLEDSGYLPRLAVMTNRIFQFMGLNGKAVLPMVLGLGCVTMATMTTRILETRRERLITTFLLALAVPCSAQLGVIMGLLGTLSFGVTAIWLGSVILTLLLSGWLAGRLVPGERPALFLELPPIRVPRLSNILLKTLSRTEWYLREAVPIFVLGTVILFAMDRVHVLEWLRHALSPVVVTVLGLPARATDAFIMGFLRRDYGAAGFFEMSKAGLLGPANVAVALVTVTLFVPCLANLLMMAKERGARTALLMLALIMPFAVMVGGAINWIIRATGIQL